MENCLRLDVDKDIIEEILINHKGRDFVQCGKCGSIKSDSKELAMTLNIIKKETSDSEDESIQELGETCSVLLSRIIVIGMPKECYKESEFCMKWFDENEQRLLPELDNDFGDLVFIKSNDVVLRVDYACGCFPIS